MSLGIVAGMAICLTFVLRAARHPGSPARDASPSREIIGGRFDSAGGRQVMPRRDAPAEVLQEDRAPDQAN
jgi:hypothetical protein